MNNTIFLIPQVIVATLLILVILLQVKESGGGIFGGGATGTPRTRRGFEKTLFQFTIGLSIVFIVLATLSARFSY